MNKNNFLSRTLVVGMVIITMALFLIGCGSTYNAVNDIPADMQSRLGWAGSYSITSYDGESVNWTGDSNNGRIFVNLPAGKHTLEVSHYNTNVRKTYYGVITFDFQPKHIYSIYCRIMVSLNNISVPSSVEFTLTDVTDDVRFGRYAFWRNSYRFGAGDRKLTTADDFFHRGLTYYDKQDYQPAISDFSETIRLNPDFILAYRMRGFAYFLLDENYELAITDLNKVIDVSFEEPLVFHTRGLLYFFIGDYNRAKADFDNVIRFEKLYDENEFTSEAEDYLEEIRQLQSK